MNYTSFCRVWITFNHIARQQQQQKTLPKQPDSKAKNWARPRKKEGHRIH